MQEMDANDFDYMTFYIANHIRKNKMSLDAVQSSGRRYIDYYKNPEVNNIGSEDEEEIIAWLTKFETPPELVFAALKEALKQSKISQNFSDSIEVWNGQRAERF